MSALFKPLSQATGSSLGYEPLKAYVCSSAAPAADGNQLQATWLTLAPMRCSRSRSGWASRMKGEALRSGCSRVRSSSATLSAVNVLPALRWSDYGVSLGTSRACGAAASNCAHSTIVLLAAWRFTAHLTV